MEGALSSRQGRKATKALAKSERRSYLWPRASRACLPAGRRRLGERYPRIMEKVLSLPKETKFEISKRLLQELLHPCSNS
jgi:hypothetical protein